MPQTQINHADIRTRFIFDDMPVRGLHVRLENVWKHIVGQKHYPPAIRRALGELLAAGALLSGNLKTDGTLIIQVQGQGRLKMLVVEATSDQTVRATARWDETADIHDDESLTDLLGSNSVFVLTLQPKDAEPWQGVVPLEGGSIAQMLINYTKRSEQLDTQIVLASSDDACGGLLLQRLPETEPDAASWEHVGTLVQTLTPEELTGLDAQHVLYRLFHETLRASSIPKISNSPAPVRAGKSAICCLCWAAKKSAAWSQNKAASKSTATSAMPNTSSTRPMSTPSSVPMSSTPS